jgi:Ca-activated chloride channel family protein
VADEAAHADRWVETPYLPESQHSGTTFALKIQLASGVPLADVRCDTHRITITRPRPDLANIELDPAADPEAQASRDFILHYRLIGDAVQTGLLLADGGPGGDGGYFLAMVQPPARPLPAAAPASDYIFVLDVSGSMGGFPLDTAKRLLTELIENLRADDTFNVLLFSGGSTVLSPASLAATPENLAAAIVVIEREQGGGGTELLPALKNAVALPRPDNLSRTIVVVTDGFVTVENEAFDFIQRNLGRANLFPFGIGSSVNRHLIEGLARAGQGEPFIVTSPTEAPAVAERFRQYIASPVLTRVRADFEGFAADELTPRSIPDVFAQRPVVLFGRWHGRPDGRIHLNGVNADGEFKSTLDVANAVRLDGSRTLELLWARARVQELEDREACNHDTAQVTAITQLGLTHGLLTKYTSFVAVDEFVRNPGGGLMPVKQPLPLPEGVSNNAVAQSVPTTPEPATIGLLIIAALALAGSWWRQLHGSKAQANRA